MENNEHTPIAYWQIWRDEDGTLSVARDYGGGLQDIESILSTELEPVGPPQNLYLSGKACYECNRYGEEQARIDAAIRVTYPQMRDGERAANVYAFFRANTDTIPEDRKHFLVQFYRVERLAELETEESLDPQES